MINSKDAGALSIKNKDHEFTEVMSKLDLLITERAKEGKKVLTVLRPFDYLTAKSILRDRVLKELKDNGYDIEVSPYTESLTITWGGETNGKE